MLRQIRKAAPSNDDGQILATHYQLGPIHEAGEGNKRGAGRINWFPEEPGYSINQQPDVDPGQYQIKFILMEGNRAQELGRYRITLTLPDAGAAPAAPAPAKPPGPPPVNPATDPGPYALDRSLEVMSINTEHQAGLVLEYKNEIDRLRRQVDEGHQREEKLREDLGKAARDSLEMAQIIVGKSREIAQAVSLTPPPPLPPQELPYVTVIKDLGSTALGAIKELAPGFNAFMGARGTGATLGAALPQLGAAPPPPVQVAEGVLLVLGGEAAVKVAGHKALLEQLQMVAPGVYLVRQPKTLLAQLQAAGLPMPVQILRAQPIAPPPPAPPPGARPPAVEAEFIPAPEDVRTEDAGASA